MLCITPDFVGTQLQFTVNIFLLSP